jgi:hypothetical protein
MVIKEIGFETVEWISLIQKREKQRAPVNRVITFGSHKVREIFWPFEQLLPYQEGFCSLLLVMNCVAATDNMSLCFPKKSEFIFL